MLTPILGIFGGIDFSNLYLTLGSGEGVPILAYGNFITAVINFLITAFVIFMLIKCINVLNDRFSRKEDEPPNLPRQSRVRTASVKYQSARCGPCTSMLAELPKMEEETMKK